jgi:hypothetical protein
MAQDNKTPESGILNGAGGTAAAKPDSTASAKAAARKKQHQLQLKNQKANAAAKKKTTPVTQSVKSTFEGVASGVNPMKGIVIAQGNGNMAGQFRVFQKKLAGAAADDKAYGLDSAILDLIAKKRTDFVKPKPDPSIHSRLVPELDTSGDPTGGNTIICFNPFLKEQMDAEYNMDLKFQSSNWNQYNRMEEGYFRTAIGNVDSNVISYCRMDKRMTVAESEKDLVLLLLILRSVCAQNHGAVKVDEEYHNLASVQSAAGYKQKKNVSDAIYAEEVLDRYGSAVFTCGKFVFGQAVYDKVLTKYTNPMTFKEYINLTDAEQDPIDEIVKERTVARLIIKNSLNERVRTEMIETYSVNNNTCYPNTISEAMSLLATFKKVVNNNPNPGVNSKTDEEALVSYHETVDHSDDITTDSNEIVETDKQTINDERIPQVSFDAHVMANVIAEATKDAEEDNFFGASFSQLQTVEDAYKKDEPDNVCFAHIVEPSNVVNDIPTVPNITYPDHMKDFELIMYHTAQRIKNKSGIVYTINYNSEQPDLISYNYQHQTAESIIDYSDAMRVKFKLAGIHDSTDLMNLFGDLCDSDITIELNRRLNNIDLKGIHTSTVAVLKEETIRNINHANYNVIRYNQMILEVGTDVTIDTFPKENILIHHVVSATAIMQHRRRPNRWVNKITHKLIKSGVTSVPILESKLDSASLNDQLSRHHLPRMHHITMIGMQQILGITDFQKGRS